MSTLREFATSLDNACIDRGYLRHALKDLTIDLGKELNEETFIELAQGVAFEIKNHLFNIFRDPHVYPVSYGGESWGFRENPHDKRSHYLNTLFDGYATMVNITEHLRSSFGVNVEPQNIKSLLVKELLFVGLPTRP